MIPTSAMSGQGNSVDLGSTASNQGGTNTVGGTVFGNYNPPSTVAAASNMMPWVVVGVVVLSAVFMMKGAK